LVHLFKKKEKNADEEDLGQQNEEQEEETETENTTVVDPPASSTTSSNKTVASKLSEGDIAALAKKNEKKENVPKKVNYAINNKSFKPIAQDNTKASKVVDMIVEYVKKNNQITAGLVSTKLHLGLVFDWEPVIAAINQTDSVTYVLESETFVKNLKRKKEEEQEEKGEKEDEKEERKVEVAPEKPLIEGGRKKVTIRKKDKKATPKLEEPEVKEEPESTPETKKKRGKGKKTNKVVKNEGIREPTPKKQKRQKITELF